MIQDQIDQIEKRLQDAAGLPPETRTELLKLLAELKVQIRELSKSNAQDAESVTGFAAASAHEATRSPRQPAELDSAIQGLTGSVVGLEASHPKLAEVVNQIAMILSNMGI
jgi:hypothetical protein